ncbi:MAG: hypothetical protein ACRCVT_00050, partial [Leadbetterella sp.]
NLKTKKETALQNVKNPFPQYPNYKKDFYTIVSKMRSQFKGPIIILSIGSFYTDNVIINDLKSYNQDSNIHFTEFPSTLNTENYFYFDDHINKKGHQIVSNLLVKKLKSIGLQK